ncbi:toxic anion resistance protein [Gordonibacter sp. 28C]|uniref:toxic anion resistance protein n=1 Tax=Gordonibacter sp. 28C TaxID=2078569 RepID=UPI000DF867A1|nr:toxic anion resistance protein [Gordonibacter sp. 28C]RDB59709.1 toxic anion resistance protein [Gordonibacter sp. 28C]
MTDSTSTAPAAEAGETLSAPDPAFDLTVEPPAKPVEEATALSKVPDVDPQELLRLSENASAWVSTVASLSPTSLEFKREIDALYEVGADAFRETSNTSSRFLDMSLAQSKKGGAQEQVSKSLVDLRNEVDELAPDETTFVDRVIDALPFSSRVKRYFRKYESNQQQLNAILLALAKGQDLLRRDNAALNTERRNLWNNLGTLKKAYVLLTDIDAEIVDRIEREKGSGNLETASALEKDALFAVRQRRQDVQTQAAVTVQAYLSMGIIQSNNDQLIRGVDRAKTTTVTALRTAVIVAQSLENQKLVLDQIDAINKTTDDMIDRTSKLLQENSLRTQEQAVSSGVSPETLKRAYDAVFSTLDSIDTFRVQANESFSKTIDVLNEQLSRAQGYLDRQNDGEQNAPAAARALEV